MFQLFPRRALARSRRLVAVVPIALLALALFAVGCGESDNGGGSNGGDGGSATAGASDREVKIALLQAGLFEYARVNLAGAEKAAKAAGNASVELIPADFDPQRQLQQCRDAITSGYDALLIFPVSNAGITPCIRDAQEANVPVASIDVPIGPDYTSTEIQVPGMTTQVIAPVLVDAKAAVDMATDACADKDPCNIVIAVGDPASSYSAEKMKAQKQLIEENPAMKVLGTPTAGYADPAKGYRSGRDILTAYPDVDVVIGDTDATVRGIERAVKEAGKLDQVALIGDGGSQYAADAIRDKRWFGSVLYMPFTMGEAAAKLVIDKARGKDVPELVTVEELSPTKGMALTAEELDTFKPEYKGE
jgi:ABC-type sugar transport system substrate-binding protein